MNLGRNGSRELLKPDLKPEPIVPPLTIQQVGLGQSRGFLEVRELPDGSPVKKWTVLKEDKLWLFDSPDTQRPGQHISLEKALIIDGGRSRSADQLCSFEVRTSRGKAYSLQAKSSGDANMWIRAMKQHTAKETENQIMDKAERLICLGELASSARIMEQARRLRRLGLQRNNELLLGSSESDGHHGVESEEAAAGKRGEDNKLDRKS